MEFAPGFSQGQGFGEATHRLVQLFRRDRDQRHCEGEQESNE